MNRKLKQLFAAITLICIALCLIALLVNAFFGSDQRVTLIFLFLIIVAPAVAFIFIKFIESMNSR